MKAFKMFANFDKEEAWLNRESSEGRLVAKVGMLYTFVPIEPGKAVVRIDWRESMRATDYADYITLFADAGWQHIVGSRTSGAQYFATFGGDATADIFSDAASRARRYRRSLAFTATLLAPLLLVFFVFGTQGALTVDTLYFTPGLWQMQGWEFVRAFLFETPLALMRLWPVLLVALLVGLAVKIAYQAVLYHRARERAQ